MKLRREFKQSSRVSFDRIGGSSRAPKRAKAKRRMSRIVRILVVLGVSLVVLIGLLWLPQIRVASVVVSGARIENPEEIRLIALKKLEGTYAFVIPRNSIFLYPKDEIIGEIEALYPRISDVSVGYRSATSIGVSFVERTPLVLWCEGEGACAFLDAEGYSFARAPHFSGAVFFEVSGTSTSPGVGMYLLSGTEFQEVLRFSSDLKTLLMKSYPEMGVPVGIVFSGENSLAFRIQPKDVENEWRLLIKRGESPLGILKNIDLALSAYESDPKNKGRILSYMDARLSTKIFTKSKE